MITPPPTVTNRGWYCIWKHHAGFSAFCASVCRSKWSDLLHVKTKMFQYRGGYACCASQCRFFLLAVMSKKDGAHFCRATTCCRAVFVCPSIARTRQGSDVRCWSVRPLSFVHCRPCGHIWKTKQKGPVVNYGTLYRNWHPTLCCRIPVLSRRPQRDILESNRNMFQ